MERYPLVPERAYPLIERIKREGGFELDLGEGKSGFAELELRNEEVMEGDEAPSKAAKGKMSPNELEKLGRVKLMAVEKKKSIFINAADRNFKAAFPGKDRFTRDLSDAPPELRDALVRTYELLSGKETEKLSEGERAGLAKLKPIMDAIGYVPSAKPVDPAMLEHLKAQTGAAKAVPGKAPKPTHRPERHEQQENRRKLERLAQMPYWLVTAVETKAGKPLDHEGLAVRVAPWWVGERGKGRLVGYKVLQVFSTPGANPTNLEVGDQLKTKDSGEIAEQTTQKKPVPALLRTEPNATKLSLLLAQDQIAPEVRYGKVQPKSGAGAQAK